VIRRVGFPTVDAVITATLQARAPAFPGKLRSSIPFADPVSQLLWKPIDDIDINIKMMNYENPDKYFIRVKLVLISLLYAICSFAGQTFAQDFKTVHDGVEYAQVEHKIGSDPVKVNLLRLDLKKVRLDVHHALDKAIGLETTSSIATRKGAVAAINSGFFRLDQSEFAGETVGNLLIDRRLFSESFGDRISLGILNAKDSTRVSVGRIFYDVWLRIGKFSYPVSGLNREAKPRETILFFPEFGNVTPKSPSANEITVKANRILNVPTTGGGNEIPRDGFVISSTGPLPNEILINSSVGTHVFVRQNILTESIDTGHGGQRRRFLDSPEDVVSGVPQLVELGEIRITWEKEKSSRSFVETRHPRTAVAKLKDGKFLMMTVDGRQPGVSVGMSLQELAEYLLSLGAVDAMNLDGGGSTTMFLDGKVVNTPSDKKGERKVGDAILVTLRKKPAARKK